MPAVDDRGIACEGEASGRRLGSGCNVNADSPPMRLVARSFVLLLLFARRGMDFPLSLSFPDARSTSHWKSTVSEE